MKKWKIFLLAAALLAALTGCGSREVSQMFALPQPPEDYKNLNSAIEQVLKDTGGESIAPQTGSNTQTVQLQDLDGDGDLESALAFVRVPGAEKPLKIYVFRSQPDDSYALDTVIEGVGSAINSVAYENVGGTPRKEVVVSWQISAADHTLGVYSLDDTEGIELLWVDSYTRFRLSDMDRDSEKEVVVITISSDEKDVTRADYYDYDGAALALKSTAPLSAGVSDIKGVRGGNLMGGIPALFVNCGFSEGSDQVVDVLCCKDGALTNVTLQSDTLLSDETFRTYNAVSGFDINADGTLELPQPKLLPKGLGNTDDFWILHWRQFDTEGSPHYIYSTFHNVTDGWYLEVPKDWESQVTISRKDSITAGERAVVFSRWKGELEEPVPFMTLYKLTGTNQTNRATLGSREVLLTDSSATYSYELTGDWSGALKAEELAQRFHIIRTAWSTEN